MTRSSRTAVAVHVRAMRRNTTCDRKSRQHRVIGSNRGPGEGDEIYDIDFGEDDYDFEAPQAGGFGGGFGGGGAFGAKPTTAVFGAPTGGAFGAPAAGGFGQTGRAVSNYETCHRLPPQQPTRFRFSPNTRDCAMPCFPQTTSVGAHNVQDDDNYWRQEHLARRSNNVCSRCWPCLAGRVQRQTHEPAGNPVRAYRASAAAAFWAACFEHSPNTTKRALSNYEAFHGLPAGYATACEVARSCAGLHGWAAWTPPRLAKELQLAFAMGTHARLGAGCPYLMMPAELVELVIQWSTTAMPRGAVARAHGLPMV
jgi:hypothetical protein